MELGHGGPPLLSKPVAGSFSLGSADAKTTEFEGSEGTLKDHQGQITINSEEPKGQRLGAFRLFIFPPSDMQKGSKEGLQPLVLYLEHLAAGNSQETSHPARSQAASLWQEGKDPCDPSSVLRSWLEAESSVLCGKPCSNTGPLCLATWNLGAVL